MVSIVKLMKKPHYLLCGCFAAGVAILALAMGINWGNWCVRYCLIVCLALFLFIHVYIFRNNVASSKSRSNSGCRFLILIALMVSSPIFFSIPISLIGTFANGSEADYALVMPIYSLLILILWVEFNQSIESDNGVNDRFRNFAIAMLLLFTSVMSDAGPCLLVKAWAEVINNLSTIGALALACTHMKWRETLTTIHKCING